MRAIEFIFESYPLAKKEFSRVADPAVVQTTIDQYKELVKKNQFRNPAEKNIDHWRRRGWEAFSQMVKLKSSDVTDTQMKKGKVVGDIIMLQDDAEWFVLIPLDKESSVQYGRGTEWCTTKSYWAYFENYVFRRNITLIYAIDKTKAGRSVAISIEPKQNESDKIEMFNQNDDPIDAAEYTKISGLDSAKFIKLATSPETQQTIELSKEPYRLAKAALDDLLYEVPLNPDAIERALKVTKDEYDAHEYITKYSKEQNKKITVHSSILVAVSSHYTSRGSDNAGQYIDFSNIPVGVIKSMLMGNASFIFYNYNELTPNQKNVIISTPKFAVKYAAEFDRPFPEGEPAIASDKDASRQYTYSVLKKHHSPSWEQLIKDDPEKASSYADIMKQPFPLGEPAIATSAESSCKYAIYAIEKPFPLGEPAIASNEEASMQYTYLVLKKHHSPSWEQLIKDDPEASYNYANIRKQPFPLGEPVILSNSIKSYLYTVMVLRYTRSESWEKLIKYDAEKSLEYAKALKQPFPAGEAAIATIPRYATEYDKLFSTNLSQQ